MSPRIRLDGFIITFPSPVTVDVAAADHRFLVLMKELGTTSFEVHDTVLGTGHTLPAAPPDPELGFFPRSVALDSSPTVFAAGLLGDHDAVLAFDPNEPGGRVLLHLGGAGSSLGLAIVPGERAPRDPVECHRALSARLPRHLAARSGTAARCMAAQARGEGSLASCLDAAPPPNAVLRRTRAAEARRCEPGAGGTEAIAAAANDAVDELLAGIFGDLDAALVSRSLDPDTAACQLSVQRAAAGCALARLAAFQRCKTGRGSASFGPGAFAYCIEGQPDALRACAPDSGRLTRVLRSPRCEAADLVAAFPACNAAQPEQLAACAAERARCAACRAMARVHGLETGQCVACASAP
jgi:hypothetical protein